MSALPQLMFNSSLKRQNIFFLKSEEIGKDQESIQLYTTIDPGHHIKSSYVNNNYVI